MSTQPSSSSPQRILITGGAGFIGAHLLLHMVRSYPDYQIYNLDTLSYAADLDRLKALEGAANYHFLRADISEREAVFRLFEKHRFTSVIHLAAESHVDRSIMDPSVFLRTNVVGTLHLLEVARISWRPLQPINCFYHISTDEVYGTLGKTGCFTEESPYRPRSPYAATKAASDHLVQAHAQTYGLPVLLSHACNNYGPFQYPEKLIPLALTHFVEQRPVPMYGKGDQQREWIYVEDHVLAIDRVFHKGERGEVYHIGTGETHSNRDLLDMLASAVADRSISSATKLKALITSVEDRPGHDFRYAMAGQKIRDELHWKPKVSLSEGLSRTIDWYLGHRDWVNRIRDKSYRAYYTQQYNRRGLKGNNQE